MTKVNKETMKSQYDGQYETFCRKNHDYGNSFEESLDQFGIVASIVRMSDKMKRLESLTDESKTQQVGSESLLDTLEDLSNYAAMTACWLKGVCDEDEVSGPNIEDIMLRSAEMEKEFNKHIPIGKPGQKEFDKNGNPIHFVDSETFSSIKKQIGISEKAVKDNSLVEGIKSYHPNYIPPGLRPEYRSGGKL